MAVQTTASPRAWIARCVVAAAVLIASFAIATGTAGAHGSSSHHHYGYGWGHWHGQHWHGHGYGHSHLGDCDDQAVPTAAFAFTPEAPVAGDQVAFDASGSASGTSIKKSVIGTITSYEWDFGDGQSATSTTPAASHAYAAEGTYVVELTVTNDKGESDSVTHEVVVDAAPLPAPTAEFGFSPEAPVANHAIAFDAGASTGGANNYFSGVIVSYVWDFGDATDPVTSDVATASHIFTEAGTFAVSLTVTNDKGKSESVTHPVTVAPQALPQPTAAFTRSPLAPVAGRPVLFDASTSAGGVSEDFTGVITAYVWDFGDGSGQVGLSVPTTTHTFASSGTFTVTLTVTNDKGVSDVATQDVVVAPAPPPYDPGGGTGDPVPTSALAPASITSQSLSVTQKSAGGSVSLSVDIALPEDADADVACSGVAKVTAASGKLRKARGRAALTPAADGCRMQAKLRLPKAYAGKTATVGFAFAGNEAMNPWSFTRKLRVKR